MIRRVLVIDDDEAIRKVFLLALEDSAFQTDTASSGKAGLEMIRQVDYDLVFLDLKMPEMDGIATLREIRALHRDLPVYIVTAFAGEFFEELKRVSREGLQFELVKKPIGTGQILQLVQEILRV